MEKTFTFRTSGVCAREIEITVDADTVVSVRFLGGCSGNTQGIASLVKGMKIRDVIDRLSGIRCGYKATSCPDQLSIALKQYLSQKENV